MNNDDDFLLVCWTIKFEQFAQPTTILYKTPIPTVTRNICTKKKIPFKCSGLSWEANKIENHFENILLRNWCLLCVFDCQPLNDMKWKFSLDFSLPFDICFFRFQIVYVCIMAHNGNNKFSKQTKKFQSIKIDMQRFIVRFVYFAC